jgi:hypothetical protein
MNPAVGPKQENEVGERGMEGLQRGLYYHVTVADEDGEPPLELVLEYVGVTEYDDGRRLVFHTPDPDPTDRASFEFEPAAILRAEPVV